MEVNISNKQQLLPKQFWVIWGIELWERFGYYATQAILALYSLILFSANSTSNPWYSISFVKESYSLLFLTFFFDENLYIYTSKCYLFGFPIFENSISSQNSTVYALFDKYSNNL